MSRERLQKPQPWKFVKTIHLISVIFSLQRNKCKWRMSLKMDPDDYSNLECDQNLCRRKMPENHPNQVSILSYLDNIDKLLIISLFSTDFNCHSLSPHLHPSLPWFLAKLLWPSLHLPQLPVQHMNVQWIDIYILVAQHHYKSSCRS